MMISNILFKKKSQTSVELMVILAIMILILSVFLFANLTSSGVFQDTFSVNQVKTALGDIESKARFVYAQGSGSRVEVRVNLPSIIQNSSIENNTLTFYAYGSSTSDKGVPIYIISSSPITGSLPEEGGSYRIFLESKGGFVNVSFQ